MIKISQLYISVNFILLLICLGLTILISQQPSSRGEIISLYIGTSVFWLSASFINLMYFIPIKYSILRFIVPGIILISALSFIEFHFRNEIFIYVGYALLNLFLGTSSLIFFIKSKRVNNEKNKRMKKGVKTMKFSIAIFSIFIAILLINTFRLELFGIVPGYAPHNFGFNVMFFIPVNLFVFISSFVILILVIINWTNWGKTKEKYISLGISSSIITLWLLQVLRILYA